MEGGWAGDIFSTSGLECMRGGDSTVGQRSMLVDDFKNLRALQIVIAPVYLGLDQRRIGELIVMCQPDNAFENVVRHDEL